MTASACGQHQVIDIAGSVDQSGSRRPRLRDAPNRSVVPIASALDDPLRAPRPSRPSRTPARREQEQVVARARTEHAHALVLVRHQFRRSERIRSRSGQGREDVLEALVTYSRPRRPTPASECRTFRDCRRPPSSRPSRRRDQELYLVRVDHPFRDCHGPRRIVSSVIGVDAVSTRHGLAAP